MYRTCLYLSSAPYSHVADIATLLNPRFAVDGVVHTYREGDTAQEGWTKVKHVPASAAVAYFDGSWRSRVRWRRVNIPSSSGASSSSSNTSKSGKGAKGANGQSGKDAAAMEGTLIDMSSLLIVPKRVRPLATQHAYESRRLWESVTSRLQAREFGEATRNKQAIEQRQRDEAAERKRKGEEYVLFLCLCAGHGHWKRADFFV